MEQFDQWTIQVLVVIIVLIFATGAMSVIWYLWQQRRINDPMRGDASQHNTVIDMEMHEEQGALVARQANQPRRRIPHLPMLLKHSRPSRKLRIPLKLPGGALARIVLGATLVTLVVILGGARLWPTFEAWRTN
ncbi:MAG: hypothetical protein HC914_10935 [Chloroflexaceae bacterium]|nr:hypothetical protein [Chloroflexaceae bacterium]